MTTISDLTKRINGDIVTPEHPEYAKSISRWACNAEKKASVVVFVKDEADVSAAILYARENHLPIAIRGGAHNPTGASSVEGGLVIDLSRYLNGVRVDPVKRLGYVGGGALWETVDKAAIEHGLATVGGTVNHTGVGGLTLAGGIGWLAGEHGLVIDNLVQVTLVSADGTVYKANETENSDLFFGVRGGGCNFGVVTEFVLALHPQRRTVFAGPIVFRGDQLRQVVAAAKSWYANVGPKEAMAMMTTCEPNGTPVVSCHLFYNGSEEEGRAVYRTFYDIGPFLDMTKEVPYEELNSLQNSMVGNYRDGVYWKGVAHQGPEYEIIAKAYEKVIEVANTGRFTANGIYEWVPLQKINSVPAGKTAYRRTPNPNCLIIIGWPGDTSTEEKVDEARAFAHEIASRVAGGPSKLKEIKSQAYSNYDPEGVAGDKDEVKDKARIVFADNYPALQRIKKKYDPESIFNKWFAITPA